MQFITSILLDAGCVFSALKMKLFCIPYKYKTELKQYQQVRVILTQAAVTRTSPSPCPFLWHHPFGVHVHSAPTQSGILDCALANHGESHRPACAAIHW